MRVQQNTLTIADFDGERAESNSGLAVWPYTDEQFGGASEARPTLIRPGANRSRGALHVSFNVTSEFRAPFAGVWVMVGPEGLATDLSAYKGLRFYARSGNRAAFAASVVRFPGQLKRYTMKFEVRPDWTVVEFPFDKFKVVTLPGAAADTSPLDPKDITSVGVSVAPPLQGQFELDIDGIEVYR
jgi:hypothetical protein